MTNFIHFVLFMWNEGDYKSAVLFGFCAVTAAALIPAIVVMAIMIGAT